MNEDHATIWLEPRCSAEGYEGRTWCKDPVYDKCDDCGAEPVKYVRADISDDLLDALKETWRVLDAAGLLNLSNGVQLGQTAWYVKASDAERKARAAIAKAEPT